MIGGHGYLLGDEGGAFWIGRRALEDVLRSAESRGLAGDPAALAGAAERRFGPLEDLHVRLYGLDRPVHAIAEFARDVCAAADAGDVAAHAILREAAAELVLLAAAAVRAAGPDGPVPLALGGRLLGEGSALRRELDHALSRSHLDVVLRSADADGAEGAVMLGLRDDPGRYAILVHRWPEGRTA